MRFAMYGTGFAIVLASLSTAVMAGGATAVPEIDGSSFTAALGLLAGGILMLRARRSR
jgi:hypothetical protein